MSETLGNSAVDYSDLIRRIRSGEPAATQILYE